MKNLFLFLLLFATGTTFGQTKPPSRQMAKQGEGVWVWAYPVKADKRQQYEHFVHDIFYAGANKLNAAEQQAFRQTRVTHSTKANADGSYTYLFIMDPVVKGVDYDIESVVKKIYGPSQGAEYYKQFEESLAGKGVGYMTTQSQD